MVYSRAFGLAQKEFVVVIRGTLGDMTLYIKSLLNKIINSI